MGKPSLTAWMICRNEERDIGRCIKSLTGIADNLVIVDTGSTDGTKAAALAAATMPVLFEQYLGASEQVDGKWRLIDFSKARNHAIELAEKTGASHLMWVDADDEILTPQAIRRSLYYGVADVFGAWIQDGETRWIQHRVTKNGKGVRFAGACHEYPIIDGLTCFTLDDCTVRHHSAPAANQEDSNARNLRMLLAEWERKPDARTAFYVASTHKDAGRWDEAVGWYKTRIDYGYAHRDEWLFAHLYGARCARLAGDADAADAWLASALEAAPHWAEFHVEQAFCAYHRGQYERAISIAIMVRYPKLMAIPITHLWREPTMYRDQPLRLISWCYEHLGRMKAALAYAEAAALEIDGDDREWNARIARLRASSEPKGAPPAKMKAIALCRPGAIGDILMTLNLIPALREANPGMAIHYFCDARLGAMDALGSTMHAAGVDVIMDCAQWETWRGRYERAIDLVGYPLAEGYPEKPMRRHLLQYFAAEMGVDDQRGLCELSLRKPTRPDGVVLQLDATSEYATLQYNAGWSRYKTWTREWIDVIRQLPFPVVAIDESKGWTLSQSIAAVANARMHIGIDSFANHLTHYMWTDQRGGSKVPGVIIFGSTQASASGYSHNINLSANLHCQPCFRENPKISRMDRGPCINPPRATYEDDTPPACMEAITVEQVVNAARELWERAT